MKKIDLQVSLNNPQDDIKKLYTFIRPDVKIDDIEYQPFSEGVINLVVKCDDLKYNDPLVFRANSVKILKSRGKTDDDELDSIEIERREFESKRRVIELAILKKSNELDITVKLVGIFKNGFIYKYVDGDVNSIELYDLDVSKRTAIKMARLHSVNLNEIANSEPSICRILSSTKLEDEKIKYDKLMKECDNEDIKRLPLYSELMNEYERIHKLVLEKDFYGKICFCHNDLNLTNLLIEKSTKNPVFIDFEWSDTNFSMFDISYHLLNLAGLFCKFFKPELVPNSEFIKNWLIEYNKETNRLNKLEMNEIKFNLLIESELKKVLVNMLLIRMILIQRALFFEFASDKDPSNNLIIKYCLSLYDDLIKSKDKYLKYLEN